MEMLELSTVEAAVWRLAGGQPPSALGPRMWRCARAVARASRTGAQPRLPRERALRQLEAGVPLLQGLEVRIEPDLAAALFEVYLALGGTVADRAIGTAGDLRTPWQRGVLALDRAVGEAIAGHSDHLSRLAAWSSVDPAALAEATGWIARAVLVPLAAAYRPLVEASGWARPYCPVCAEWAALEVGRRGGPTWLTCTRCAAHWPARDVHCRSCGGGPPVPLGLAGTLQGAEAVGCASCGQYVKRLDRDRPLEGWEATLVDLATEDLDRGAVGRGYARFRGAGYRVELAEERPDEALEDALEVD